MRENWLDAMTLAAGGEATWNAGALRLRLEVLALRDRASLFRGGPIVCDVAVQAAAPAAPGIAHAVALEVPAELPHRIGPFWEPGGVLSPRRGAGFEISAIDLDADVILASVRAFTIEIPCSTGVRGDPAVLAPDDRQFVTWWIEHADDSVRWRNPQQRSLPYAGIPGFELQLAPFSSGTLALTFHRDGDRYFARTLGGSLSPIETWYGPFIASGAAYVLAP